MGSRRWSREVLAALAESKGYLCPGDAGYSAYQSDVVLEGDPDAVARPRNTAEIQDLLAQADDQRIPVTPAGGQTSLTGGSVAEEGVLLATEGMDRILDIAPDPQTGNMTATAEPGIFLGVFQRALEAEGWFYPPDPTSRNEARLGATVATNATGEDTLLYGPTRRWIRGLRVVTAGGKTRHLRRPPQSRPVEEKATAGYYPAKDEIDLLVGSEGTLGVITEVTVDVIPKPAAFFSGMAFFPTLLSALQFVVAAREDPDLRPRTLELVDRAALEFVGDNTEGITYPAATGAAIVFKQEYRDSGERETALAGWFHRIEASLTAAGVPELLDRVLVMDDSAGQARLRAFRHRIPASLNEEVSKYREAGGGKVGTDWWVPYGTIPEFLEGWRSRIQESGVPAIIYGHIGNGHPHVNFIPKNGKEKARARLLMLDMCRAAVAAGGGVAGEHGLGKTKRDLLAIQYPPERIAEMRAVKRQWDPRWILGRGNILEPDTHSTGGNKP